MRIISGSAKGRILKSPKGMLTRPTLDRTRESLFNILANGELEGADILDIFAGTGALGLEALSRGAASGVFIDHYTQQLIKQNAALCGFSGQCEVLRMPYNKNLVNNTIALICQYDLLAPHGLLLMERSKDEDIADSPLYEVIREKAYGKDTRIAFIRRHQGGK